MTHVLLVEDDAWLAASMQSELVKAGYVVSHAPHAYAAIDQVERLVPDVLVVDMLLTGSTGLGLLHELPSYTDTKNVPVIMCTNLADSIALADVRPYGVRLLLDKTTMLPSDLAVAVRSVTL